MAGSTYSLELWTPNGQQIADLTSRAVSRRITQTRNDAETISWNMDLDEFERYAKEFLKGNPSEFIVPGITEVRVKRLGTYICGGKVTYANPRIAGSSAVYSIQADGFLNLWLDRISVGDSGDPLLVDDRTFLATEPATMLSTLIQESQGLGTDWDFGVTIGLVPATGTPVDKTYKQQEIKEGIQYGNDQYNIDHEFTYNKVFNQYLAIGSMRPDAIFEYPGNILEIPSAPMDATTLENWILVRGSGSGTEAAAYSIRQDSDSQHDYKVRQKSMNYSDVDEGDALDRHGDAQLAAYSRPFQIPQLVVDGNKAPYVTDYGIGDFVVIRQNRYETLNNINGFARVEKRIIDIDDNDRERVTLYVSK